MRYALYRHHARAQARPPDAVAEPPQAPLPLAAPRPCAAAARPPNPAIRPTPTREIVFGSQDGLRTIKVRESKVTWRKPKKLCVATPAGVVEGTPAAAKAPLPPPSRLTLPRSRKPPATQQP